MTAVIGIDKSPTTDTCFWKRAFVREPGFQNFPPEPARPSLDEWLQCSPGFSLRIVRDYDINADRLPTRCDILYGYKTLRPQLACRLANLAG
jgi:hypothetical protein